MKDKKNLIIVCLLLIIFLLIGIILGVLVFKKTKPETLPTKDEPVIEEKEKELTTDELLTMLEGEWGMCLGEYNCRGIIISVGKDGNYLFTPYIMWSDGGEAGTVQKTEKTGENIYKLTVYYKGYDNELGSSPERTEEYNLNITDIESSTITVGDTKYQKITGDREAFFNSIMK